MKSPFDKHKLAAQGVKFSPQPRDFPHSAEIIGLSPSRLGQNTFAAMLSALRRSAEKATNGDYGLVMTRDPNTKERRGYAIYAHDADTVERIAKHFQRLISVAP
jgi:hypothetical protein